MNFFDLIQQYKLFDSHCHLNNKEFNKDRTRVIQQAFQQGIEAIIDVGMDIRSSQKSIEITSHQQFQDKIFSTIGIHPEVFIPGSDLYEENEIDLENIINELTEFISHNLKYIAFIGETGLDYYWLEKNTNIDNEIMGRAKSRQQQMFLRHIELARKFNLPLTIHSRSSVDDCINLIIDKNVKGVFHSLTPDELARGTIFDQKKIFYDQVNTILEMGFFIGINGIITYKSAKILREVFTKVIKEKTQQQKVEPTIIHIVENLYNAGFVLETDSPLLKPSGFTSLQKKRNEPGAVKVILEFLQKIL